LLLATLDLILMDPVRGLLTLATMSVALISAITIHESSHAVAATTLGDETARRQGRLSLNPLAHLDPFGTALIFFAGFGWGKPVPVNPMYLRISGRHGMALVSLAGPVSNIVAASLFAIPIQAGLVGSRVDGLALFGGTGANLAGYVLVTLVFWNLLLAAFNLLPVAPLDGFKVALGVLPNEAARGFARSERYGPGILMLIIMADVILPGPGILSSFLTPVVNLLSTVVIGRGLL
jgi:Zn-dependent protease